MELLKPNETDTEKASNSYLMSLLALLVGMPLPIVNLIATFIFYMCNRNASYFVRWHCTQALLSQLSVLFLNSYAFWWTVSIIFTDESVSNSYFAYLITLGLFNLFEFVSTIYTAIEVRKGKHVRWWIIGQLTDLICKSSHEKQ
jgi:uncharacterized Tic20 family protein